MTASNRSTCGVPGAGHANLHVSPAEPADFTCYTSFFGDPFTFIYGLAFLDLDVPRDIDGEDWFQQGQTAYQANVEFFKKERGYLDGFSAGFSICAPNGFMAKPNGNKEEPIRRTDGTVYTLAGGLSYYSADPASNPLAATLSSLVTKHSRILRGLARLAGADGQRHTRHQVACNRIVGQDILFIGLAIDNYLGHRAQNLVLEDPAMRRTLDRVFPPRAQPLSLRILSSPAH